MRAAGLREPFHRSPVQQTIDSRGWDIPYSRRGFHLTRNKCRTYDATIVAPRTELRAMAKRSAEQLTRREREIMSAIFSLGNRASAEEIRLRMSGPPSYSAVRVTLSRLESKGHVKHQSDGIRYIYSATTSPIAAKRTALRHLLNTFFEGSMKRMMTALVREGSWSGEDLDAVKAEIEQARKQQRRGK
jgi:predicted transcriptional regulator